MLPVVAGRPAQKVYRARLHYKAAAFPLCAGFSAKAKGAKGKERNPDNIAESRAVFVPADGGTFHVLGDKDLLQLIGSKRRKALRPDARVGKKAGHVLGLRKAAAVEIVSPAERHDTPFAFESLEFEFPEWQSLEILQKRGFFFLA
jgi:hypothetical protein